MMNRIFLVVLLVAYAATESCRSPRTAVGYTQAAYLGKWYQIGKYQTPGGAYFEKDCLCTESDISQANGKTYAYQSCVKSGKRTGINATLIPTDTEGKYIQQFSLNRANYYVIYLDQKYAIEYDCKQSLGVTNYCVHIMSRTLSIPQDDLALLKTYALGLDLNPRGLPFQRTEQVICRNTLINHLQQE